MKSTAQTYAKLLHTALMNGKGEHERALVKGFATILVREGHVGMFNDIRRQFKEITLRKNNKISALVTTAREDTHVVPREIKGQLVEVQTVEDKKLIGGVRVRIGDMLIDNTITRRINNLKKALS